MRVGEKTHSGQLGCRGSEPARSTAIAEGLPCHGKNLGDSPKGAADLRRNPGLFVGIFASLHGEDPQRVVRLNDDLVDSAELLVFFEKFELTLEAWELRSESEADCSGCVMYDLQLLFGELVVVDY